MEKLKFIVKCPSCGKKYCGWIEDKCPSCRYYEGMPVPPINKKQSDSQNKNLEVTIPERSRWYAFAEILIILGFISVVITLFSHTNWFVFWIVLGVYVFSVISLAILQLIANTKYSVDKLCYWLLKYNSEKNNDANNFTKE